MRKRVERKRRKGRKRGCKERVSKKRRRDENKETSKKKIIRGNGN